LFLCDACDKYFDSHASKQINETTLDRHSSIPRETYPTRFSWLPNKQQSINNTGTEVTSPSHLDLGSLDNVSTPPIDTPSQTCRLTCAHHNNNMESLLSLSFDNISSKNPKKVGKGFRQIEGLLAQICLSSSAHQSPVKRTPSAEQQSAGSKATSQKHLHDLVEDLAFREFFRLQESFEWNGNRLCISSALYFS
jgi:hypothetical protein